MIDIPTLKCGMEKYQKYGTFFDKHQRYTGIGSKFSEDKKLSKEPEVVALYGYSIYTGDPIISTPNKKAHHDGLVKSGKKIEVKDDAKSVTTGNFAFEIESSGKPSAIQMLRIKNVQVLLYWGPWGKHKAKNGKLSRELFLFEGDSLSKLFSCLSLDKNGFDETSFRRRRLGRIIEPAPQRESKLLVVSVKKVISETKPVELSKCLLNDTTWKGL